MPSAIAVELKPKIRQLFPEQVTLLPAFVVDGPATTVTLVISEEKLKDHCSPAVCAPPDDVKVIGRAIVEPAVLEPEPIPTATLCPNERI